VKKRLKEFLKDLEQCNTYDDFGDLYKRYEKELDSLDEERRKHPEIEPTLKAAYLKLSKLMKERCQNIEL